MKSAYQLELESKLSALIDPIVQQAGAELVELQLVQRKSSALLRLLVDKVGGIKLDDCTEISRRVSDVLESDDPIEGRYTLEVSSPGLDRPLTTEADFRRKVGETVKLTAKAGQGTFEATGQIISIEGKRLTLKTDEGEKQFALEDIVRGKIIY